ncbi:unnamed protein product [Cyclocybe aegerita]|uniref:F-box domain-containing protein n=1 Tax=Cyclocybe aegerita TaxID=1973307 RepID=A0A8S0X7N6_CYCAE|nr:unnamed protein product [Cyclocybe aegerita]
MPRAPRLRRCPRVSNLRQRRLQAVDSNTDLQAESYRSATPALSLPIEVTCAIFEMAVGPSPFFTGGEPLPGNEAIAISQVCKKWRGIALDYTPLWTIFAYSDKGPMGNLCQGMILQRLQLHLDRSRGQPIDFWVNTPEPDMSDLLYDAFTQHMSYWRRVALQLNPSGAGVSERIAQPDFAPNLEAFAMAHSHPDAIPHFPVPGFKLNAPNLATLRMDFRAFKTWAPPTTITHLDIDQWSSADSACLPWSTFLDIISSPTLTNLTIRALTEGGVMFDEPASTDIARRVVTNLEHLHCSEPLVAQEMWGFIHRAPCLQGIYFDSLGLRYKWNIRQAVERRGNNLFGKNYDLRFPVLRSMSMTDCRITRPDLECLAKMTPRVIVLGVFTVLTKTEGRPVDVLMSRKERSGEHIIWPELGRISVNIKGLEQAQYDSYSEFLLGRSEMMKLCRLSLCRSEAERWQEQDAKSWQKLIDAGVVRDTAKRITEECS